MTRPASRPLTPRWSRVLGEQLRSVGLVVRPALAVAVSLQVVLTLVVGLAALRDGEGILFVPEFAALPALAAVVLPVAVWRGEYDVRRSYLASLPVDRSVHLLTKLAAGWAWLMALTAAFVLGMVALALVTGGAIGGDELRVMAHDLPVGVPLAEVPSYARRWTTPLWQWATFFTVPTVGYLAGSTLVLAGGRVRRWLAGAAVTASFLLVLSEEGFAFGGLGEGVGDALEALVEGTYGLETLFGDFDPTLVGETTPVWDAPPTARTWILTTLIWMGIAAAGVFLMIGRDRTA